MTHACEPAASIRALSAATSRWRADERLGDVVDPELESELEVGEILLRERGNRERDARDVDALVRLDHSAGHDPAERAAARDALHAKTDVTVVDEDLVAGLEHRRRGTSGATGRSPSRARLLAGDDDLVVRRRGSSGAASSPTRIFGPCRSAISASGRPASACASRTRRALCSWSVVRPVREVEPQRRPSRPRRARRGCRASLDAGPIVATIFVRRSGWHAARAGYSRWKADQPGYVAWITELLLDPEQLVVLRDAIGARGRAGLDLARRSPRPPGRRSSCPPSRPERCEMTVA